MVEMKIDVLYPLFYILVTWVLILQVAATTIERKFSVMNIIKNRLNNWMGNQWINDFLVRYIVKIYSRLLSMKKSCNGFKIWKIIESNWVN